MGSGESYREADGGGKLDADFDHYEVKTLDWCRVHYGEAVVAWAHVKDPCVGDRSSDGLPPEFDTVLLTPKLGKEKKCAQSWNDCTAISMEAARMMELGGAWKELWASASTILMFALISKQRSIQKNSLCEFFLSSFVFSFLEHLPWTLCPCGITALNFVCEYKLIVHVFRNTSYFRF